MANIKTANGSFKPLLLSKDKYRSSMDLPFSTSPQLAKNAARNKIADYYRQRLLNSEFYSLLKVPIDVYSSYHLAIIKIKNSNKILHRNLFEWMRKNKVWVQLHYWPIHLQPYYRKIGFTDGYLPNSEEYAQSCFSIPLHFKTSKEDQDFVLNLLDKGIKELVNNS